MVHLIIHFFEEAHQRFAQASKTGMIEDVRNILRMHQELCDVVRQLNEIFSLQLLFLIGTYFKIIFINVFFFYADFGTNIQLTSFYYTSVNCIKLIFCVYSCNKCAQQANIVKEVAFNIVSNTKNRQLWKEVHAFMLQLHHEKVQVEAGGFFPVDFTIIFSIFAASSTYIIIIVQCMESRI
ncbi:unnamed protein product [Tenebrio molitor]|nr:unnamed protein product [Tenebrio molitor]